MNSISIADKHYETEDLTGLKLQIYKRDGIHYYQYWIVPKATEPRYQVTKQCAWQLISNALDAGSKFSITNGNDFLVLEGDNGNITFPPDPDKFFKRTGL